VRAQAAEIRCALETIRAARAARGDRAWALATYGAPGADGELAAASVLSSIAARGGGVFLDPVFAHGISLREPAGPADVDLEEVE
jgi:hypothetical protein